MSATASLAATVDHFAAIVAVIGARIDPERRSNSPRSAGDRRSGSTAEVRAVKCDVIDWTRAALAQRR